MGISITFDSHSTLPFHFSRFTPLLFLTHLNATFLLRPPCENVGSNFKVQTRQYGGFTRLKAAFFCLGILVKIRVQTGQPGDFRVTEIGGRGAGLLCDLERGAMKGRLLWLKWPRGAVAWRRATLRPPDWHACHPTACSADHNRLGWSCRWTSQPSHHVSLLCAAAARAVCCWRPCRNFSHPNMALDGRGRHI